MCQAGRWGGLLGGVGECEGDTQSQQVDIDRRALVEGMEKKIVLKGVSDQIIMAKQLIEDKVKEEVMMRSSVGSSTRV